MNHTSVIRFCICRVVSSQLRHASTIGKQLVKLVIYMSAQYAPLPSNRHHRSNGDCLEGKRENYQVCSLQYCVQQLYTV